MGLCTRAKGLSKASNVLWQKETQMENLKENLEKISKVADAIREKKDELIEADLKAGSTY